MVFGRCLDGFRFYAMIEYGKILEFEDNLLLVQMRGGETIYAPFIVGVGSSVPSETWIMQNKDNFLAVVAFEKNLDCNPMVIGFYPLKRAVAKNYDVQIKLVEQTLALVEELTKAKVLTYYGEQSFMPDTIVVLKKIKAEVEKIKKDLKQ